MNPSDGMEYVEYGVNEFQNIGFLEWYDSPHYKAFRGCLVSG
jgi:hypothetical protein